MSAENEGKIKIGEKEYAPQEIEGALSEREQLRNQVEQSKGVLEAAAALGLDPSEYARNATGAMSLVVQLMEQGVIDGEGKVIAKPAVQSNSPKPALQAPAASAPASRDLELVLEAIGTISKRLESVESDSNKLIRLGIESEIKKQFPDMDSEDISKTFAVAMRDRSKSVLQHAESIIGAKKNTLEELRKKHAQEFGIDLEQWNKMREPGAGGAGALFKGKQFSFKKG